MAIEGHKNWSGRSSLEADAVNVINVGSAGRFQDCIDGCSEAESLCPLDLCTPVTARVVHLHARALVARGLYSKAQVLLETAVRSVPDNADCWQLLSGVCLDFFDVSRRNKYQAT